MNKYILLDINHGADYLATVLKDRGYEVIVYDIYQTKNDIKQQLIDKNIKVIDSIGIDFKDYIVAYPIHCPLNFLSIFSNNQKISHHELVKCIYKNKKNVIEITGSKSKTTTANVLAYLASFQENVFINSSIGFESILEGKSNLIVKNNSISPGYTFKILAEANDSLHIFEESLGVCGVGEISILTSATPIYPINGGKGRSLEAKKQLFRLSEKNIIIDGKDKTAVNLANDFEKNVFKIWEDISIEIPDYLEIGKDSSSKLCFKDLSIETKFNASYLLAGYLNPILFSAMALKILNKDMKKMANSLYRFQGVKDRLTVISENDYIKIIDKSGGFSEDSLEYLLTLIKDNYDLFYNNIYLLIDLTKDSHCQKIDVKALDNVVGKYKNLIDEAFILGNYNFETFKYLKNSDAFKANKGDLIIECGRG